jgi:Na+/H+ antiporter NhaD/arsenite permease-like protein
VPAFILSRSLHGDLVVPETKSTQEDENQPGTLSAKQRVAIFYLGVGGLIFVPIFKTLTHLPPFVGILLVLGILWTITETMYSKYDENDPNGMQKRVSKMLTRIDMPTIMFFLGILMAVGCLQSIGVLTVFGEELNSCTNGNHYLVTGIIGVLSSIMDNVPLVAGCMNMYPAQAIGDFSVDGIFWQLLAYCAGVGGSILIIGSAAGVVIMGLEKITFGWYMRKISWVAFVGYLSGIIYYWIEQTFLLAA